MRIRLQITTSPGTSFSFEHAGGRLRLGRDPEGELALAGESNQSVSWNHAAIELTPSGAFLSDVNSTNGTFLNDKRVVARTAFKLGDQIQLGYTGPMLKVVELEMSEATGNPAPPPPIGAQAIRRPEASSHPQALAAPGSRTSGLHGTTISGILAAMQRMQRNVLIGAAVLGACVIVLVITLLARPWRSGEDLQSAVPRDNVEPKLAKKDDSVPNVSPTVPPIFAAPKKNKSAPTPPRVLPTLSTQPSAEHADVGSYVAEPKDPPSVLLQRERDPDPWGRLHPDSRIQTGYYLVSLPGYRSKILLDSGVRLLLWGDVPEFSKFPPVLESTVVLHTPPKGTDLDVTLDRGRVHLSNYKTDKRPAHIRVRFHQEVWDLALPNSRSEVALELWGLYPPNQPAGREPGTETPLACVGLFVKGGAQLTTPTGSHDLPDMSQFVWSNERNSSAGPGKMSSLPKWWTDRIDPKAYVETSEQVSGMLAAFKDFSEQLGQTDAALPGVLTQVRESIYPENRRFGVLCLGALDAVPQLVDALEDRQHYEARWAAIEALQIRISRSADYDGELYRTLTEKNGYSKENATIVWRLLHGFSEAERNDPNTYQKLISYLGQDRLSINELAWRHLASLAPQLAKEIPYDPADPKSRKQAYESWNKKLPPGALPPRPAARSAEGLPG